jgi:hypothetical protein
MEVKGALNTAASLCMELYSEKWTDELTVRTAKEKPHYQRNNEVY